MIKTFTITIALLFFCNNSFSQLGGTDQLRDSLKHKLAIAKDDTSRVLIMADIANAYWTNNFDSISKYGNEALALSQRIQFPRGEVSALNALGVGLQSEGDYPKSLEYLYRGLQIAEEKNYIFETAVCYTWIGLAYWYLEDYPKSIDFYNKSQHLFETIINHPEINNWVVLNIGAIGQSYLDWNQLDSAHRYLSEYYNATLHDEFAHPVALYNLGDYMFKRGNRDTSFNYVRESIAGSIINNDYVTQAEAYAVLSRFFKVLQNPDSAIYYAKKGLAAAASLRAYKPGAYKNNRLLALEYEQLNEEQIKKENRLRQYGFIAGLAIVLSIAFILYRNNLQKKKANILLQHQKEKVESTMQELKSTQAQLIQSEKMASLGELTAGIAHEIQNPLNFVNNFSEVNDELISELVDEVDKGNIDEAKAIAADIKQNLEKINQHGKRADAIVKGMLQHSRAATGKKEPTDINALADEYLRLSYHGMRAKDKSFNVTIETDFDNSIGKINVVPQDIGRVLLNLYNNAFYAVTEKTKTAGNNYEPTVIVGTKKVNDKIEITVRDNGNGITKNIIDKIFQPFFTTKPTGQGTGLGLSLAYDIIKAHGGEIRVETKENEGSEFVIQLSS